MLTHTLFMAGLSDTGRAREHNEDAISWDPEHGLALLADGMGGHQAGDVASRLCLESLNASLLPALEQAASVSPAALVRQAILTAHQAVLDAGAGNPHYQGMGATLVLLLFHDDRVVIAHAGDSRVYRLRRRSLERVTVDHSLVQDLLTRGLITAEQAADSPYGHVITMAIGTQNELLPEVQEHEVQAGDVYLLCSDGLTDMVEEDAIRDTLLTASGNWARAAQHLIDLANQAGGTDNISVVLAAVGAPRK
jgi:protein phosphatase